MHIKKDDLVEVITGDDAEVGRSHRVLRVLTDTNKVVVEGVNKGDKHVKPNRRNPRGGPERQTNHPTINLSSPICPLGAPPALGGGAGAPNSPRYRGSLAKGVQF